MKITQLILILQQLQENGLDDVTSISPDEEYWWNIKGTRYQCGIPHEKNKMGSPFVELTLKKPIVLEPARPDTQKSHEKDRA